MSAFKEKNAITHPGDVKSSLHHFIEGLRKFKIGKTGQPIDKRAEAYSGYDNLLKLGESSVKDKVDQKEIEFINWSCDNYPNKCQNEKDVSTANIKNSGNYKLYIAYEK